MRRILLILSCILLGLPSYGQLSHLTTADGLPSNRVYQVFKDSKGFMWFCTDKGVCRFDGTNMELFKIKDGLADNEIFHCFEDNWGRLWFGSFNGKLSYFYKEKFYNSDNSLLIPKTEASGLVKLFIPSIKDSGFYVIQNFSIDTVLWIGLNSSRIERVEQNTPNKAQIISYVLFYNGIQSYFVHGPKIVEDNNFFFNRYITRQDLQSSELIDSINYSKNETERFLYSNTNEGYLLLTTRGAYEVPLDKELERSRTKELSAYKKWGENGFYGLKTGLEIISTYRKKTILKGHYITSIDKSNYENIYITTYSNGVYILKKNNSSRPIDAFDKLSYFKEKLKKKNSPYQVLERKLVRDYKE